MRAHRQLLLSTALLAVACAGANRQAKLREQLDAYSIPKPLTEVWPDAMRFVAGQGYGLVGRDRTYLSEPEQAGIGAFFSKGHETQAVSKQHWQAETAMSNQYQRYRVDGYETGPASSRIEYTVVKSQDPVSGGAVVGSETEYRDVQLELEFMTRYDARAADRMEEAAKAR